MLIINIISIFIRGRNLIFQIRRLKDEKPDVKILFSPLLPSPLEKYVGQREFSSLAEIGGLLIVVFVWFWGSQTGRTRRMGDAGEESGISMVHCRAIRIYVKENFLPVFFCFFIPFNTVFFLYFLFSIEHLTFWKPLLVWSYDYVGPKSWWSDHI